MATTKKETTAKRTPAITESSGDVFADLGFANPELEQLKADLSLQIYRTLKARGLTQAKAGELLGVKQPQVSSLMPGRSGSLSVGRLMEFLAALGQDVQITVRPTSKEHGAMSVTLG